MAAIRVPLSLSLKRRLSYQKIAQNGAGLSHHRISRDGAAAAQVAAPWCTSGASAFSASVSGVSAYGDLAYRALAHRALAFGTLASGLSASRTLTSGTSASRFLASQGAAGDAPLVQRPMRAAAMEQVATYEGRFLSSGLRSAISSLLELEERCLSTLKIT